MASELEDLKQQARSVKEHSQARLQVASHEALAVAQQQGLAPEARAYDDAVETSSVASSSNLRKPSRCPPRSPPRPPAPDSMASRSAFILEG